VLRTKQHPIFERNLVNKGVHKAFLVFLAGVTFLALLAMSVYGASYYITPLAERPFHPRYETLRPTGALGMSYGVVGTLLILGGVILYSSRKRLRLLSGVGRLQHVLNVHIFLCVTGPLLILFHTTFKFGGLVGVSFWSMAAVVGSGVVGRYLYAQIPRGIQGEESSAQEIEKAYLGLTAALAARPGLSREWLTSLDRIFQPPGRPSDLSLPGALKYLLVDDLTRQLRIRRITSNLRLSDDAAGAVRSLVRSRLLLHRRLLLLEQTRRAFHYWHVIHLPFTIVMFVILALHVGVAIAFGYRWIF
jgi:hypothetical protein